MPRTTDTLPWPAVTPYPPDFRPILRRPQLDTALAGQNLIWPSCRVPLSGGLARPGRPPRATSPTPRPTDARTSRDCAPRRARTSSSTSGWTRRPRYW